MSTIDLGAVALKISEEAGGAAIILIAVTATPGGPHGFYDATIGAAVHSGPEISVAARATVEWAMDKIQELNCPCDGCAKRLDALRKAAGVFIAHEAPAASGMH